MKYKYDELTMGLIFGLLFGCLITWGAISSTENTKKIDLHHTIIEAGECYQNRFYSDTIANVKSVIYSGVYSVNVSYQFSDTGDYDVQREVPESEFSRMYGIKVECSKYTDQTQKAKFKDLEKRVKALEAGKS